jgi:hypothetical protein
MLPGLLLMLANPGPIPDSPFAVPSRRIRVHPCLPPSGGSSAVYPECSLRGACPERSVRGVKEPSVRFVPISDAFLRVPKVIDAKGLAATITPLESILTGCAHLFENTQVQPLQNQHLRIFSSQALWIQHLHKNMGGGGGAPGNSSRRTPSASPHPPRRIKVRVLRHPGTHETAL